MLLLDIPDAGRIFFFQWEMDFLHALQNIHTPFWDKVLGFLSVLGNAGLLWIAIAVILILWDFVALGGRTLLYKITKKDKYKPIPGKKKNVTWVGFEMGCAMLLTYIIGNLILKNTVARMRPCWIDTTVSLIVKCPEDYSFPSGHTMNGFTGALCIFYHDKRWGTAALVLAAVIAFSRMYLFVHFPTDILAGIVIGVGSSLLMYFIFKKWRGYLDKKMAK